MTDHPPVEEQPESEPDLRRIEIRTVKEDDGTALGGLMRIESGLLQVTCLLSFRTAADMCIALIEVLAHQSTDPGNYLVCRAVTRFLDNLVPPPD